MNNSALKPDVFADFRKIREDERIKDANKKGKDPDDISLAALSNHDGWRVLVEYIEHLKQDMDNLTSALISNGGSFEDIGKNTVVVNLCKEQLDAIIQKVNDSREVVDGK